MKALDLIFVPALSIIVVAGLYLFGLGARNLWWAFSSTRWPTVSGVVQEANVVKEVSHVRYKTSAIAYIARITFGYQVHGRKYQTNKIGFGQAIGTENSSDAELRRLRYPVGAEVPVSYNPRDPSIAVVKPGFDPDVVWIPGAGLGLILIGVTSIAMYLIASRGGWPLGLGMRVFAIIIIVIGGTLLTAGLLNLWRASASQHWPVTRGVIVYARQDEDGATRDTRLAFEYDVNGQKYFSNTRRFGEIYGSDYEAANKIMQRYPGGAEVRVAYSPDNPELAVLDPGFDSDAYYLPGAGAAVLLFGVVVLIATFWLSELQAPPLPG